MTGVSRPSTPVQTRRVTLSNETHVAQAESVCIRTTKVYDWCYKNGTTSFVITDLDFPDDTATVAGIDCEIVNVTCTEIERNQAGGGIAIVTLRKQATFEITFIDALGNPVPVDDTTTPIETQVRTRFWDEFVQVCAPEGTTINCEVTESGCRSQMTAVNGTEAVQVDLFVCQSIQVEAEVKICVDIVDFCVPDICEQVAKPFACPPTEFFPPQCDPLDPRYTPPCASE